MLPCQFDSFDFSGSERKNIKRTRLVWPRLKFVFWHSRWNRTSYSSSVKKQKVVVGTQCICYYTWSINIYKISNINKTRSPGILLSNKGILTMPNQAIMMSKIKFNDSWYFLYRTRKRNISVKVPNPKRLPMFRNNDHVLSVEYFRLIKPMHTKRNIYMLYNTPLMELFWDTRGRTHARDKVIPQLSVTCSNVLLWIH